MANICSFSMKVRGKKENIEQFYKALTQDGRVYMGRGADANIDYEDGDNCAFIDGCCKWSIRSALIDNAVSMRTEPDIWYFGDGVSSKDFEFITLFEACKRWNIVMEVYSEESGCCFQEHFICDKGEVICNDCIEWNEYCIDDYDTKEEADKDFGIVISDNEWNSGDAFISRGGFENWDFEI